MATAAKAIKPGDVLTFFGTALFLVLAPIDALDGGVWLLISKEGGSGKWVDLTGSCRVIPASGALDGTVIQGYEIFSPRKDVGG